MVTVMDHLLGQGRQEERCNLRRLRLREVEVAWAAGQECDGGVEVPAVPRVQMFLLVQTQTLELTVCSQYHQGDVLEECNLL
jgi:hypothetical protein